MLAHDELADLVADGLSVRKIAERLDVSAATVRYWLGKFGLATRYAVRSASRRTARGASRIELDCAQHGATIFIREGDRYRCGRCRSEAVTRWRRRVKEILVEEAGGRCALCGYDRCLRALEFHMSTRRRSRSRSRRAA